MQKRRVFKNNQKVEAANRHFMRVKDIMKTDVAFCRTTDNLMRVASLMRQRDCGIVPIVDEKSKVVGVLTDRDLCLAVVARNRKASDVKAADLIGTAAIVCRSEDKIETVLKLMKKNQIKRLAVTNESGELAGIVSISDLLLGVRKSKNLKKKIYSTLKAVAKPRPIVLREVAANDEDAPFPAKKSAAS